MHGVVGGAGGLPERRGDRLQFRSLSRLDHALADDQTILTLNRDQAKLSTDSEWIVVPGATHVSLATNKENASKVSESIRRIVEKVRARPALGQ
jgi:hypothetical protein